MTDVTDTVIEQALTDARNGLRVLVIASNSTSARTLLDRTRQHLEPGEKARGGGEQITLPGRGVILYRGYAAMHQGAGRGLELDRVLFDHSSIYAELLPCLTTARDGGRIEHHPNPDTE